MQIQNSIGFQQVTPEKQGSIRFKSLGFLKFFHFPAPGYIYPAHNRHISTYDIQSIIGC